MAESSARVSSVTVPPVTGSVAVARRFVRDQLVAEGYDDDVVDTVTLLASEVVTNAVLHANTDVSVRLVTDSGVLVEVIDGSVRLPRPRRHDVDSVTGRGLELVEMLATGYGVRNLPVGGKAVWFSVGAPVAETAGWGEEVRYANPTVVLRGLPIAAYAVLQEHNEALLREYALEARSRADPTFTPEQVSAAAAARAVLASAFRDTQDRRAGAQPAGVGAGTARTPGHGAGQLDLTVRVPLADVAGFELLPRVLDDAEAVAVEGRLLTRPALPEMRALRSWALEEIVRQLHGAGPSRWAPATRVDDPLLPPALDVDTDWVRRTDRAVVVADDGNAIVAVSAAAAALLGWPADELVGRRVIAIVPERLREAHVTGFTRLLVTGAQGRLGEELDLPALRRDGSEVPVRLRLERTAADGRTLFLGWLDRR